MSRMTAMRNESTLQALVAQLQANCGDTLAAARAVGVSLQFVNQWRKDDKITDDTLTEAERVGVQGLYSAAVNRAVTGVRKGVYHKGLRVDEEVVYSDGLLQTLLKAKLADFKEASQQPLSVQVNVANLMPRATSYDQWLEMKATTLAIQAPTDPTVLEADFTPVTELADLL